MAGPISQTTRAAAGTAAAATISVRGLSKTYTTRSGSVEALRNASFEAADGQFVSLVGPSGCGKSTMLKIVAGLEPYHDGIVDVAGRPPEAGRPDVGIMLQSPVLLPWRTVHANVMLPTEIFGGDRDATSRRATELLRLVGLKGFEDKHPWELSGGMQQRVSLARLLVFEPALLLLDEPFSALDEFTRAKLTIELSRIHSELRRSALYVTHNIPEAVLLSDRVVVMKSFPGEVIDIVDVDLPHPRSLAMLDDRRALALMSRIRGMFSELDGGHGS